MLIVGRDALTRTDSEAILGKLKGVANKLGFVNSETGWNGFNVLHRSQGEVNALELGIRIKPSTGKHKVIFLLGCDNYITPSDIPTDAFVVYIVVFFLILGISRWPRRSVCWCHSSSCSLHGKIRNIWYFLLLFQWILRVEFKWVTKSHPQQVKLKNNGKFSELCQRNVEFHCLTTACRSWEPEFMRLLLTCWNTITLKQVFTEKSPQNSMAQINRSTKTNHSLT